MSNSFSATRLSYATTGYFTKIITDYLSDNASLKPFYLHRPTIDGIKQAIAERKKFETDRKVLVDQLHDQYSRQEITGKVKENIGLLLNENTFTVTTAHQPNIFTGHLYFIYKILHTIKLADTLKTEIPGNNFVPVFYIGSEDADLEELGEIWIRGEKYKWETKQTGAVGRMKVDKPLMKMLDKIEAQVSVESHGKEVIQIVRECYREGVTIQDACFCLVNKLFGEYGLVVLLPDNAALKSRMQQIFHDDIFSNTPSEIVSNTSAQLSEHYKVQAHPREINLFYLQDGIRNRIVDVKGVFHVNDTDIRFTKNELVNELNEQPEKFSPNVILRALYQESILPNLVFVGGGGELAYWLELKDMFLHYQVPFPVLLLRNSFMIVDRKMKELSDKLGLDIETLFRSETDIIKEIVLKNSRHKLNFRDEKERLGEVYHLIGQSVKEVDKSLEQHVKALMVKQSEKIDKLEKKVLRAEKKKFEAQQNQLKKLRAVLFPNNSLQERVDNFIPFYARWGKEFIHIVYENSLVLEQEFTVLTEE